MFDESRFIEKLRNLDVGKYDMAYSGMMAIWKESQKDPYTIMYLAFQYGFMRGQNKAKNELKKKVSA